MRCGVAHLMVACAVAGMLVVRAAPAAAGAPPEAGRTAAAYANALAAGDLTTSWHLLSGESRRQMSGAAWEEAFRAKSAAARPNPRALLKNLVTGPRAPAVGAVLPRGDEALAQVGGTVQITQEIVLVREEAGWRVDLAATDVLNARQAAQTYLDAVREETTAGGGGASEPGQAVLRLVFGSQVKEYGVVGVEPEGADRARVTVGAEVPVNLVVLMHRAGPGWEVDVTRPLLSVDPMSADPLREAVAVADRGACEENLRQLGKALQMYAAMSDGMFPDPERWLEGIRAMLPEPAPLHCPADGVEGISYAMNRELAGKRRDEIASPGATPLLFESTLRGANPADSGGSWAEPPRHPEGNLVVFVDGSVRAMRARPSFRVATGPAAPRVEGP